MNINVNFILLNYKNELNEFQVRFLERENHLKSGEIDQNPKWVLHLSVVTKETLSLLKIMIPVFVNKHISFTIVKNQLLQYQLNAGVFGEQHIGKVISIYPKTVNQALELASQLNAKTQSFNGLICPSAQRIEKILYAEND